MTLMASKLLSTQAEPSQFWQGAALYEQCVAEHQDILERSDVLYAYGYEFLGMAYSVYIHQVLERIHRCGIDHVLFVAREGYLFEKIYEILKGSMPVGIEATTSYAYMSRVSTFLASSPQLTTREIVLSTDKPWQQGLWSALKFAGLPVEAFEPHAEAFGIDMKQPILEYWNDQKLLAFLNDDDVQSAFRAHHQRVHRDLYDYLGQCGFWGEGRKVALVDIGWDGTIQDSLVRAYNHLPEFPLLHGLYFGRREFKTFLKYSGSFSNGLIFDHRDRNINGESANGCIEMFEKGAGAPHASTRGYERDETGRVRPVFKSDNTLSRQEEVGANASIAVMQQGALDFAYKYARRMKEQSFEAVTGKPFVQGLITRHIAFPTYQEAYQVAHRLGQHAEDMGEDTVRGLALKPDELWAQLKSGNLKAAKGMFQSASWNAGSLRLIRVPGLHFLYTLKRYLFF